MSLLGKFEFTAIGFLQSPFKDRFAVPRQHGFAGAVKGVVKLRPDANLKMALRDLEEFSHIWLLFVFHAHGKEVKGYETQPSIRHVLAVKEKLVSLLRARLIGRTLLEFQW
jgi:tRNA (Thr-GGU) A37 N-methylase